MLVVVIGVALAVLLPALPDAREASRRMACQANLKQIGLAIHNYDEVQKCFPPGTVCTTKPIQPGNQYDVWKEAARTGVGTAKKPGPQGTAFLLRILPYTEGDTVSRNWNSNAAISNDENIAPYAPVYCNSKLAGTDIDLFFCPARRRETRPQDKPMMLPAMAAGFGGGGTDYGGCAGRHAAFSLPTGYNLCDATTHYDPDFVPAPITKANDTPETRCGIFGRVNVSTKFTEILDGTSNTIMTGELQRITEATPTSKDGWVIGGPATLFTTGAMFRREGTTCVPVSSPSDGLPVNNGFFGSPGSDHPGGANFGMADGSVRFFPTSIDPNVFALLGSMADGAEIAVP